VRTHRTAAIVVNYNSAPDLARCAQSLLDSEKSPLLVLVDNASVTGGIEEAVAGYPEVEVIRSPENLGFGRGNNLGIRRALSRAGCEFVFLLNNDAMVERDTISRLEAAMDGYPEAGIIAPRIVLAEDPGVLWYGGGEIDWRKGSPRVPDYLGPADSGPALTSRNVTFASGCAIMVRRSVLEEVGGFDPRLFMYQEDLELCLRVQRSGWVIRYLPEALVLHKGQGTDREGDEAFMPILSPRNPRLSFYALHVTKGRLLSMSVHARGMNALRFLAGFPVFCLYKGLQYVRHGRWDGIRSMLRGTQEALQAAREPFVNELDRSGVCAEMTDRGRERMIFVVGNSRSGTTMMGRILGAHPSVYTFGELHFFEQLWSPADEDRRLSRAEGGRLAARLLSVQRQGYLSRANPERFQEEAGEMVASAQSEMTPAEVFGAFLFYEAAKNGKKVPCDQTPRNVFYLREILELYPEARVINMIRDPRDILLSQKGKWKRRFLGAGSIPLREALRAWVKLPPGDHQQAVERLRLCGRPSRGRRPGALPEIRGPARRSRRKGPRCLRARRYLLRREPPRRTAGRLLQRA